MKILQINASYKPAYIYGGPTMSVAKLAEHLVEAGIQVDVFTTTANGVEELPVIPNRPGTVDGVNVTYFKRVTKGNSHLSPALLYALWREVKQYDLVHIHAWWNMVSVLSAFIANAKNVPVVFSPRGTLSSYSFSNRKSALKNTFHNFFGKRALNRTYIHATSDAEKNDLAALLQPKKIFNIPNFVKIAEAVNSTATVDSPVFKLFFLSRIEEKKGLDILLKALPLIKVPFHLTIAGDGDENYILQLKKITENESTDVHVSWIGFQNDNKFDVLRDQDLLVLPSYNENFGNVVIESLSVGTAVLVSEHVGLADYVEENKMGWVCQTDAASVGDRINEIATSKRDELNRIRKDAPELISNSFNEDKLVSRYIDMYNEIVNSK